MKTHGVNRVVIAVKEFDQAVDFYSRLLNVTFPKKQILPEEPFGVVGAVCWEGGIELLSPLPDTEAHLGKRVAEFIDKRGEGIYGVIFSVDSMDEGRARAEEMGIRVYQVIEFNPEQIKEMVEDRFEVFKEAEFEPDDTFGILTLVGQFKPKQRKQ